MSSPLKKRSSLLIADVVVVNSEEVGLAAALFRGWFLSLICLPIKLGKLIKSYYWGLGSDFKFKQYVYE
jgi:hypothetical protein